MTHQELDNSANGEERLNPYHSFVRGLLRDAAKVSWSLFKIMIPVVIVTKILKELGAVDLLGQVLAPVMQLVGLPGELGLVWATAMVTNIYGGMAAFGTIGTGLELTTAQVTVLMSMILFAHGLPVELRIAQKAGPRLRFTALLRVGCALVFGVLFSRTCLALDWLQQPNTALWQPPAGDPGWLAWALGQVKSLALIFVIILGLLLLLRVLDRLGFNRLLSVILSPLLRLMGMSSKAAPITVIGMTLGLSYGGGLIIRESQSGRMSRRDVLLTMALLSICHSLIEDTLLMAAAGAHHAGILWGRAVFSILVIAVMSRILALLPQRFVTKHIHVEPVGS